MTLFLPVSMWLIESRDACEGQLRMAEWAPASKLSMQEELLLVISPMTWPSGKLTLEYFFDIDFRAGMSSTFY